MSDQINLYDIVDVIKNKVCVLVIGPDLVVADAGGQGFYEGFQEFLSGNGIDVKDYYLDEGFFYFSANKKRYEIRRQLEEFCKKALNFALENEKSIYQKIARIPFDLILSFSPDLILKNVFEQLKINHAFHHYSPGSPTTQWNLKAEIGQKPVLINLVGKCDSNQDLILTHEDFIRFFSGMYGHNKLPDELIEIFKENRNYYVSQFIILGYRYEKWHYKLLLDKLNFPGDDKDIIIKTAKCMNTAIYSNNMLGDADKRYYETKFLTSFCTEYGVKEFIEKLYGVFDEKDLRQPRTEENDKMQIKLDLVQQIKEDSLHARLDLAIANLNKLLPKSDGETERLISEILSDYNAAQKRHISNRNPSEKLLDAESNIPEDEARKFRDRIRPLMNIMEDELKSAGNVT